MSRIRVLIADDHAMVREGLARLVSDQPEMRVVAEAADGEQAVSASCAHDPHVVLLDMRMPGLAGVAAIAKLRERCPRTRILVLSMYEDSSYARAALAAGAHAYVAKSSASSTLLAAIRALYAGGRFVDERVTDGLPLEPDDSALSAREREVLRMLVRGHTGRETASALGISKSSADTYRARIFRKLGVNSRAALLAKLPPGVRPSPDGALPDPEVP